MRAGEDEAADEVVGAAELEPVGAPDRDVGALAGRQRADVVAAEHRGAAAGREPQRLAGAQRRRRRRDRGRRAAPASPRGRGRCARSTPMPSTPSPTRAPASSSARTGATPAPSRRFEVGQWATPTPGRRTARPPPSRGGRSARTRRRRRASRRARGTRPACSRRARGSTPPPRASRRGACGARARAGAQAPADSSISRVVTENGEHGATAIWTARRRRAPASRSVSARTRRSPRPALSGGSPPSETAEVHRPARGDDPHAELARGAHLRLDQARDAAREDVVVVEDRRAARQGELGEAGARRGVLHLLVDPRPDGVQRAQPREEVGLLRPRARQGLVEVVMRVHEPGRDDGAAEVLGRPRRVAGADGGDQARPRSGASRGRCSVPRRPS